MINNLSSIPQAIDELRNGKMIIVVDDEDRENEGDLIMPAELITEEQMSFVIRHTSGIVFFACSNSIADKLELPPMVKINTAKRETPFTVSIEAAEGVDTGVSAKDRVHTIHTAIKETARPEDLSRPGHVFPLRAKDGGVLVRAGHTEASVDLMKLSGLCHGAVGAELMNDNGTMMRLPDLKMFAEKNDLIIISIADLIAYRQKNETLIRKESESKLETSTGSWKIIIYTDSIKNKEHVALVKGKINSTQPTLVRVHSQCFTGDVLKSKHCDCGEQLKMSMEKIEKEGTGIVLYLKQEGRGIGLAKKIEAYNLQCEKGLDTVEANLEIGFADDLRDYGIGAQILKSLGVCNMRLLTNNPRKIVGLKGFGLHIVEQVSIEYEGCNFLQKKYLKTKKEKLGHKIRSA
ncbi:MAG: 3,4-dihydroxy-2-butanone-4-phosphate synthase [Candidatus Peribacteraceae bacterium]|nr:3,4-dihydroxy-2-butanone-4-phosphate synthase [Candidatus Peribacteraceae bacterium]